MNVLRLIQGLCIIRYWFKSSVRYDRYEKSPKQESIDQAEDAKHDRREVRYGILSS